MSKKSNKQPELLNETPAVVTNSLPGDPAGATPDIMDETPDTLSADMRKFNRSQAMVSLVVGNLKGISVITDAAGVDKAQLFLKEAASVEKAIDKKRLELSKPYRDQVDRINDYGKDLIKPIGPEQIRVKNVILAFHKEQEKEALKKRAAIRETELESLVLPFFQSGHGILVPHYWDTDTACAIYRRDLEEASDETWRMIIFNLTTARTRHQIAQLKALEQEKEGADFFGDDTAVAAVQIKIDEAKAAPVLAAPTTVTTYVAPKTKGLTKRWQFEVTDASQVPRAYLVVAEALIRAAVNDGERSIPGVRIYEEESISIR